MGSAHPVSSEHRVHLDIVGLGKRVGDKLEFLANPEPKRVGTGLGEEAIVKSAAAAEATATVVECEAWTEEYVDF